MIQTRKQIVQRANNLTISTTQLGKDNSNFYSKFFIKLPTTFVLNNVSNKQLKVVEKFSLDRLLQFYRFAEGYYKFKNTKVGSLTNSHIFTKAWNFIEILFILQSKLYLRLCSYFKNSRNPESPDFTDYLDDP